MKKKLYSLILALIFVFVGSLGLLACKDDNDSKPAEKPVDISGKTAVFTDVKLVYTYKIMLYEDNSFTSDYVTFPNPSGTVITSKEGLSPEAAGAFDNMAELKTLNTGKKVTAVQSTTGALPKDGSIGKLKGDMSLDGQKTLDDIFNLDTSSEGNEYNTPFFYEYFPNSYYAKYYTLHMYRKYGNGSKDYLIEAWGNLRGNTLTLVVPGVALGEFDEKNNRQYGYAYQITFTLEESVD